MNSKQVQSVLVEKYGRFLDHRLLIQSRAPCMVGDERVVLNILNIF
jgi:hypothetical protein